MKLDILRAMARYRSRNLSTPSAVLSKNAVPATLGSWWYPQVGGPSSIFEYSKSIGAVSECRKILDLLTDDDYLGYVKGFYDHGLALFGENWAFHDINTVLLTSARVLTPVSYLEIGVRRGRSTAMVLTQAPHCEFVGFDMWIKDYAGMDNPGPEFVREELRRIGHKGSCEFVDGNSRETVPEFFRANPQRVFDIITVDGDHSVRGARLDLENVKNHLKIGGVLVFDDTANHSHPGLAEVWRKVVGNDTRFATVTFNEVGFGVGIATRKR